VLHVGQRRGEDGAGCRVKVLRSWNEPGLARIAFRSMFKNPAGSIRPLLVAGAALITACGAGSMPSDGSRVPQDTTGTFAVSGNPESPGGATWTFRGTVGGVTYDLAGILLKPPGAGPFAAVVLSHGADGSASFFGLAIGPAMVQWGLVCIATNYTHATGVPIGAPGTATEPGASQANVLRAHMTHELLRRLGYVDMSRVAAHGHSMGAYLDVATIDAYPSDFRVASHTGGGVRPDFIVAGPAPTTAEARMVHIPYQMHHGDADLVVPLSYEQRLDSVLTNVSVPHELYVYPGADHLAVRLSPVMLAHVHDWYAAHGMF
jgi:dienelactone hydrolase